MARTSLDITRTTRNARAVCTYPLKRQSGLKHLCDWSFDECEREVRGSLVYRAFCRIDCERGPDAKTLIRLTHLIGPETLKPLLERMVGIARQRRVSRGHRLRVDTTVVETNIHYPTDSSLLADGVRVLTRFMKRLAPRVSSDMRGVRDRTRSVTRRVFELVQRSRAAVASGSWGSWGGQRPSLADYVTVMGPTDGAPAAGGC